MKGLINWMNGMWGRSLRVLLGLALIYVGLVTLGGSTVGMLVAIVGLLPIAMELWGHCLLEFVFYSEDPGRHSCLTLSCARAAVVRELVSKRRRRSASRPVPPGTSPAQAASVSGRSRASKCPARSGRQRTRLASTSGHSNPPFAFHSPLAQCTLAMATSMEPMSAVAAMGVNKPTARPSPPKNSPQALTKAQKRGGRTPSLSMKSVWLANPLPPNQENTIGNDGAFPVDGAYLRVVPKQPARGRVEGANIVAVSVES